MSEKKITKNTNLSLEKVLWQNSPIGDENNNSSTKSHNPSSSGSINNKEKEQSDSKKTNSDAKVIKMLQINLQEDDKKDEIKELFEQEKDINEIKMEPLDNMEDEINDQKEKEIKRDNDNPFSNNKNIEEIPFSEDEKRGKKDDIISMNQKEKSNEIIIKKKHRKKIYIKYNLPRKRRIKKRKKNTNNGNTNSNNDRVLEYNEFSNNISSNIKIPIRSFDKIETYPQLSKDKIKDKDDILNNFPFNFESNSPNLNIIYHAPIITLNEDAYDGNANFISNNNDNNCNKKTCWKSRFVKKEH